MPILFDHNIFVSSSIPHIFNKNKIYHITYELKIFFHRCFFAGFWDVFFNVRKVFQQVAVRLLCAIVDAVPAYARDLDFVFPLVYNYIIQLDKNLQKHVKKLIMFQQLSFEYVTSFGWNKVQNFMHAQCAFLGLWKLFISETKLDSMSSTRIDPILPVPSFGSFSLVGWTTWKLKGKTLACAVCVWRDFAPNLWLFLITFVCKRFNGSCRAVISSTVMPLTQSIPIEFCDDCYSLGLIANHVGYKLESTYVKNLHTLLFLFLPRRFKRAP